MSSLYRMFAQIARWPYARFYTVPITSYLQAATKKDLIPGFKWPMEEPVAFCNVVGEERCESTSFRNDAEVREVSNIVCSFLKAGLPANRVAVITPYSAQKTALKATLATLDAAVCVDNIDAFQGLEYDLIIVSFVRANNRGALGFVSCFRRINVALTRARTGLILVGNGNFWYRFSDDMRSLLDEYIARKCIVGPPIDMNCLFVTTTSVARPARSSLGSMKQSLSSSLLRTVGGTMTASSLEWHIRSVFKARETLLLHPLFGSVMHYVLQLDHVDLKAWSHYGAVHGFGINEDPGNGYYAPALIVLCLGLRSVPHLWRDKLQSYMKVKEVDDVKQLWLQSKRAWIRYVNDAGDILEAFAGLLTFSEPASRKWCSAQQVSHDNAKCLNDLHSRYVSQVKRVTHAFEARSSDVGNESAWTRWMQEAARFPACVDMSEAACRSLLRNPIQQVPARSSSLLVYGDRFPGRSVQTVKVRTPSPQSANTREASVCMVRGTGSQQAEMECTKCFEQAFVATAMAERCPRDLFCKASAAEEDISNFSLTMNSQLGTLLIVQLKEYCQEDEGSYYGKILAAAKSLSNHPRWTSNKRQTASASWESHRAASASEAEVISPSTARNRNAEDRIALELALAESMQDIEQKPSSPRGRSSSELHVRHVSPENVKRPRVQRSSPTVAHAGSSQSQATSSSSNQWQEPTPSAIYDTCFLADKKKERCKSESIKDTEPKPSSPRKRSSSELHTKHVSPENVKRPRLQTSFPLSANALATAAKPPCKRSIDTDPVGIVAHAGSSQSQATSSSSNQQKELTPAAIFDTRFLPNKKKKRCICDSCGKLVKYGRQTRPFEGNFLYAKEVPEQYANHKWNLETKEKAWNAGLWNATWYCVECLGEHHQRDLAYVRSNYIGDFTQQRASRRLFSTGSNHVF